MASSLSFLFYFEKKRVAIAVVIRLANELTITAGIAFTPQLLATTTEIHHATFSKSHVERLCIHPGHHQNVTGFYTLRDSWYQTVGVVGNGTKLLGGSNNDAPHGRSLF